MGIIHSKNYSIRKKLFKKIFIQKIWKLFIQKNYSFCWKIDYRPGLRWYRRAAPQPRIHSRSKSHHMATSLQHTLGGSRLIFKDRDWLFIDTTHFVRSDSIFNTDPCQAQSHNFWFAFNVQWWSCASSLPPQSCLANYFVCVSFLFWFSIPVSIYPSPNFFTFVEEEKTRHLVSSLKLFQISFCICRFFHAPRFQLLFLHLFFSPDFRLHLSAAWESPTTSCQFPDHHRCSFSPL